MNSCEGRARERIKSVHTSARRAPYLLENRSGQPLRYRQSGISDLPYIPLPAYSAAGFAWQTDKDSGGTPRVIHLASSANLSRREDTVGSMQLHGTASCRVIRCLSLQIELCNAYNNSGAGTCCELEPQVRPRMTEEVERPSTGAQRLSLPSGNELQVCPTPQTMPYSVRCLCACCLNRVRQCCT